MAKIVTVRCDVVGCPAQREISNDPNVRPWPHESGWIELDVRNGAMGMLLDICPEHRKAMVDVLGVPAEVISQRLGIR